MSTKRTSTKSSNSNDEETTENSDAVSEQEDNAKRGKFASFSDTTLQDIPTEILQCILVKAVVMEVKNMKLVKSVWKEKADLVISRLGSVCSQWNSVLTTDFFRMELHRALDGIAQENIRLEILSESYVGGFVSRVTTLKDEILMLCYHIHVYDRNNLKEVKEFIELPWIRKGDMAACNVSNCVYVLNINEESACASILRIARDEEHKFKTQTWISELSFPIASGSLSVSDKGNLIIVQSPKKQDSHAVSVYYPNGLLQHEIILCPDTYGFSRIDSCIMNESNGNLVLALANIEHQTVFIMELDTDGIIQRQFKSSLNRWSCMDFADTFGRILIYGRANRIELLDSELNLLEFTGPQKNMDDLNSFYSSHFNSERNEVIGTCIVDCQTSLIRILRFRED